jgi:outer membrane protein TolC
MAAWQNLILSLATAGVLAGCTPRPSHISVQRPVLEPHDVGEGSARAFSSSPPVAERSEANIAPAAFEIAREQTDGDANQPDPTAGKDSRDEIVTLVAGALASNPRLHQMQQEAAAAWERVRYIDELPDPEVGAMAVVPPMHYADGRQVAIVSFRQSIPWLQRLNAREQQAYFQAWALDAAWRAERLRTISDLKVAYYRLYALEQQLRVNRDNRQLIELLTRVATDRVAAQSATEGDVLLGTLELSRLEEQRLGLVERQATLRANINRLLSRSAETPVRVPLELSLTEPAWSLETLRQTAWSQQPDIAAAQLRSQAASWGIRVAELERRPDVTFNLDWMVMRPQQERGMPAFGGDDSVQVGAMVNVPLWHEKYNAMRDEAVRESIARRFTLVEVQRQYEAMLAELLEQARAASRTAALYNSTMLPQARQTFEADQRAYVGPGTVEFDRVIEDFRTVLTLEEGYHRAMSEWAIALSRIEQAVAVEIHSLPVVPNGAPPAEDATRNDATEVPAIRQVSASLEDNDTVSYVRRSESSQPGPHHGEPATIRSGTINRGAAEFLVRKRRRSARDY